MSHQEHSSPGGDPKGRRGALIGGEQQPQPQAPDPDERRPSIPPLPTTEQVLGRLDHLSFLVLTDVVPTSRANTVHGIYRTMLGALGPAETGGKGQLPNETLLKLLRDDPQSLSLFKPMMSPEQLTMIMEGFRDDTQRAT